MKNDDDMMDLNNEPSNEKKDDNRRAEKKKDSGKKGTSLLYKIVLAALIIVFAISLIFVIRYIISNKKADNNFKKLAKTSGASKETKKESKEENTVSTSLDWNKLHQENKDIIAWIKIADTEISYPVLMSDENTDTDYYLLHNLDNSAGKPGCLYVQKEQKADFTDFNTIIYGHNMYNNGTMFNHLTDNYDKSFFDAHTTFTIETETELLTYKIYSATSFDDRHLLYKYDFSTDKGRQSFIDDITAKNDKYSHHRDDMKVTPNDHLVTLSTCMTRDNTHRYLVVGVLQSRETISK
jgi:sortase B